MADPSIKGTGRPPPSGISPVVAGLRGQCPRCGAGRMFAGFLSVVERCEVCGLSLSRHDSGDGPAVFVILILGFVVVGLALWVEVSYAPPLWLHALLWFPAILFGALAMLRPLKGVMIALQYRHRPGDYDDPPPAGH